MLINSLVFMQLIKCQRSILILNVSLAPSFSPLGPLLNSFISKPLKAYNLFKAENSVPDLLLSEYSFFFFLSYYNKHDECKRR